MEKRKTRPDAIRYLLAIITPMIVAGVMHLSWPFFKLTPISLFLMAVMVCAWYGGFKPGMLCMAFSFLLANYFFIEPYFSLGFPTQHNTVFLVTLATVGSAISALSGLMHSARRRAESSLTSIKQSEERYRSLVNATAQVVWSTDTKGQTTDDLRAWRERTGQTLEQVSGEGWMHALYPSDRERLSEIFLRAARAKVSYEMEGRVREQDGSYRDYLLRGVPVFEEDDATVREWIMTASDISERKRAEKQFRQVIDGAPNGMILTDRQGRIAMVNTQTERSFGYDREELLGQSVAVLVPERFRARLIFNTNNFMADPTAKSVDAWRDFYGLRKDGSEFPVEISMNLLETEQGLMVLGAVVDITERQQAEEALRESEALFRTMTNSIPQLAWMASEDGHVFWYNQRWHEYTGTTPEQMKGGAGELVHPDVLPEVIEMWRESFAAGQPFTMEFPLRGADGHFRTFLTRLEPLKDSQGRVMRWFGTNTDVEELKQAEASLRESETKLSGIIGSAMDAIISVDDEQRIILFNGAAEKMFRCPSTAAVGQSLERFIPERFRDAHKRHIESFGQSRVTRRSMGSLDALVGLRADGEEFPIEASISQLESKGRKLYTVILRDITEREHAEQNRRRNETLEQHVLERTAQLQAANKELEAFSYSVSHDLRAPLRHINGFSQALLEDYADRLDEVGRDYLQQVREASREMAQLIDDVLQLARVTRSELRREAVDLGEVAEDVMAELRKEDAGRVAVANIEEGLSAFGDRRLLRIVLSNLLGNAWKFTSKREHTEIAFGREQQDGRAVYFVRDNGAGFDMTYADKLFGAFQRLHSTKEFEGTGIGLATVQRIVHRHGGRVWAESTPGRGATFYFTLAEFQGEIDEGQSDFASGR